MSKKNSNKDSSKEPKEKGSLVKVEILLPVSGKYSLSASVGDKPSYSKALADELIESKYAKLVK